MQNVTWLENASDGISRGIVGVCTDEDSVIRWYGNFGGIQNCLEDIGNSMISRFTLHREK